MSIALYGLLFLIIAVGAFNVISLLRKARHQNYEYWTDENGVEHVKDNSNV